MKLIFNEDSTREDYEKLFLLGKGDVFKVSGGYETVMRRIEEFTPPSLIFEVFPITPGTDLYTLYGDSHIVIVAKQQK